jgi:hypothetical protein
VADHPGAAAPPLAQDPGPLARPVLGTALAVAAWSLAYQNSGWVQFGYRFSLDYMVLLVVLLAIGGRPFGSIHQALIVVGIVVNLFGAITFTASTGSTVWTTRRMIA